MVPKVPYAYESCQAPFALVVTDSWLKHRLTVTVAEIGSPVLALYTYP